MRLLDKLKAKARAREELPSQREFLSSHLIPSAGEASGQEAGLGCGICLEDLSPAEGSLPRLPLHDTVVYLKPCSHFFHGSCIMRWHNSNRPERNSCPLCRRTLYIADPLTATQIRLLHGDTRPFGPHRQPGPDEELVSWDLYYRDMEASYAVNLEMDRVVKSGGQHRWLQVTRTVRDNIMVAGGRLRPELEPHYNTSVLMACAISVLMAASRFHSAIRSPAFVEFNLWIDALIRGQEDPDIWTDLHINGMFDCNFLKVVTVPKSYRLSRDSWVDMVSKLRDELVLARELRRRERARATAVANGLANEAS